MKYVYNIWRLLLKYNFFFFLFFYVYSSASVQIIGHYFIDNLLPVELSRIEEENILVDYKGRLEKLGLIIDNNLPNPDVIFCHRVTHEMLQKNIPIIVLEMHNCTTVLTDINSLMHPHVLAVFKQYTFRNQEMYAFQTQLPYHAHKINQIAGNIEPVSYDSSSAYDISNKVKCVPWLLRYTALSRTRLGLPTYLFTLHNKREIDVFFAGISQHTVNAPMARLYSWHRQKAVDALAFLQIHSYILPSSFPGPKPLSYLEYLNAMHNARIAISPWGTAEFCHRDFEAWLCGAVLIKPDTDFVTSMVDYYQSNITYVPCAIDFSDLEEKVDDILKNWKKYEPMRKRAQNMIRNSWSIQSCLEHFVTSVYTLTSSHKA